MDSEVRLLWRGGLALLVGLIVLISPKLVLATLVLALCAHAAIDGLLTLWMWRFGPPRRSSALPAIAAIRFAIAGGGFLALSYASPNLALVLGAWAILSGVLELWVWRAFGANLNGGSTWALFGASSVLLGICVLAVPVVAPFTAVMVVGGHALLFGIALASAALPLRTTRKADSQT